jgi:hypothetical protein
MAVSGQRCCMSERPSPPSSRTSGAQPRGGANGAEAPGWEYHPLPANATTSLIEEGAPMLEQADSHRGAGRPSSDRDDHTRGHRWKRGGAVSCAGARGPLRAGAVVGSLVAPSLPRCAATSRSSLRTPSGSANRKLGCRRALCSLTEFLPTARPGARRSPISTMSWACGDGGTRTRGLLLAKQTTPSGMLRSENAGRR